jgi:hypothetical protein
MGLVGLGCGVWMDGGAEVIEGAGRGCVNVEEEIYWLGAEPLVAKCIGRVAAVADTGESKPDDAVVPLP